MKLKELIEDLKWLQKEHDLSDNMEVGLVIHTKGKVTLYKKLVFVGLETNINDDGNYIGIRNFHS